MRSFDAIQNFNAGPFFSRSRSFLGVGVLRCRVLVGRVLFLAHPSGDGVRHNANAADEHQPLPHLLQRHDLRQQRLGDVVADLDVLGDLLGPALLLPVIVLQAPPWLEIGAVLPRQPQQGADGDPPYSGMVFWHRREVFPQRVLGVRVLRSRCMLDEDVFGVRSAGPCDRGRQSVPLVVVSTVLLYLEQQRLVRDHLQRVVDDFVFLFVRKPIEPIFWRLRPGPRPVGDRGVL